MYVQELMAHVAQSSQVTRMVIAPVTAGLDVVDGKVDFSTPPI